MVYPRENVSNEKFASQDDVKPYQICKMRRQPAGEEFTLLTLVVCGRLRLQRDWGLKIWSLQDQISRFQLNIPIVFLLPAIIGVSPGPSLTPLLFLFVAFM
jgi:hypothetical protein